MRRRSQRGGILEYVPELGAIERANARVTRERRAKEREDRLRQAAMENQANNNQQPEIAEGQHPNGGANALGAQPQAPGARRPAGRPIGAFDEPNLREVRYGIPTPAIEANNFEVKSSLIAMAQNQRYNGLPLEDPLDHLDQFERLCRTVKMNGVPENAIKMILFPFSLGNKASQWEKTVPSELVSTWDNVKKEFITKFYPKQKTAKLRNDITSFKQGGHENLYEAWDRLKDYIRRCPHHGVSKENLLGIFYRGALEQYRRALDTASHGCFSNQTAEQGEILIENLAQSEACYGGDYDRGVPEQNKDNQQQQIKELTDKVEKLSRVFLVNQKAVNFVGEAGGEQQVYSEAVCDGFQEVQEEVNYVGNQNNYQGGYQNRPYNQSFGNNNLSYRSNNVANPQDQYYPPRAPQGNSYNTQWKSQGGQNSAPANNSQGDQKYRPPHQRQEGQDDIKSMMKQLVEGQVKAQAQLTERLEKFERKIDSNHAESQAKFADIYSHLKNLDNQVAQVASSSKRPTGTLPGKPEQNPKEYCNAIALSVSDDYWEEEFAADSYDEDTRSEYSVETEDEASEISTEVTSAICEAPRKGNGESVEKTKAEIYTLLEDVKLTQSRIVSLLGRPELPESAKNKLREEGRDLKEAETAAREAIAKGEGKIIENQEEDPGKLTLPCAIGSISFPRCLCDLGSSINAMPLSVAEELGYTEFGRCIFDLVLADRSTRRPEGVLERVPVKIQGYTVFTDFVVISTEEERGDPLIFGRPFLATVGAMIDCKGKSIWLRLGNRMLKVDIKEESHDTERFHSVKALDTSKERKRVRTPEEEDSGARKVSRGAPEVKKDEGDDPDGGKPRQPLHDSPVD